MPLIQQMQQKFAVDRDAGIAPVLGECGRKSAVVKQTLEGNDIWATTLPMLALAIQKKAADLCSWEKLTA